MDMELDKFSDMSFRIGEVAAMFDISTKTLRIYDRIGLLKPSCINGESGYRYYSPDQLSRLEVILNLKRAGFSLKEIFTFINGDISNNEIITIFQNKHTQLQNIIDSTQYKIELIDNMVSSLMQGALVHDQLTEQEKAVLLSRIACLENAKLEESLTQILWL